MEESKGKEKELKFKGREQGKREGIKVQGKRTREKRRN